MKTFQKLNMALPRKMFAREKSFLYSKAHKGLPFFVRWPLRLFRKWKPLRRWYMLNTQRHYVRQFWAWWLNAWFVPTYWLPPEVTKSLTVLAVGVPCFLCLRSILPPNPWRLLTAVVSGEMKFLFAFPLGYRFQFIYLTIISMYFLGVSWKYNFCSLPCDIFIILSFSVSVKLQ